MKIKPLFSLNPITPDWQTGRFHGGLATPDAISLMCAKVHSFDYDRRPTIGALRVSELGIRQKLNSPNALNKVLSHHEDLVFLHPRNVARLLQELYEFTELYSLFKDGRGPIVFGMIPIQLNGGGDNQVFVLRRSRYLQLATMSLRNFEIYPDQLIVVGCRKPEPSRV